MPTESSGSLIVSVVIPAHNPHRERLRHALLGLRAQMLPADKWETLLVDNASSDFPAASELAEFSPRNIHLIQEPRLGLTSARITGIRAARGTIVVLVDDDNVLAPNYLSEVVALFQRQPHLGAAGGKSKPVFEVPPEPWLSEFFPLLAVRDLGESELIATSLRHAGSEKNEYPAYAPIGAGMAIVRECALGWAADVESDAKRRRLDRTGSGLVSGGDNDIVMALLEQGRAVGYFPSLCLDHLIPGSRLDPGYLSRLNRAIQRSWIQVLELHGANPWPRIAPWSVLPRQVKSYFRHRAWRSQAGYIRWQGACGQFEGQASI
jgi:glycosyltransferase involved in cell wall biosynthesis